MSYLGKASNDYACPIGLGDNKTITNGFIRMALRFSGSAAVAIYYGVRSSVKTLNEINKISAR